jgi:hypothetical protein
MNAWRKPRSPPAHISLCPVLCLSVRWFDSAAVFFSSSGCSFKEHLGNAALLSAAVSLLTDTRTRLRQTSSQPAQAPEDIHVESVLRDVRKALKKVEFMEVIPNGEVSAE